MLGSWKQRKARKSTCTAYQLRVYGIQELRSGQHRQTRRDADVRAFLEVERRSAVRRMQGSEYGYACEPVVLVRFYVSCAY